MPQYVLSIPWPINVNDLPLVYDWILGELYKVKRPSPKVIVSPSFEFLTASSKLAYPCCPIHTLDVCCGATVALALTSCCWIGDWSIVVDCSVVVSTVSVASIGCSVSSAKTTWCPIPMINAAETGTAKTFNICLWFIYSPSFFVMYYLYYMPSGIRKNGNVLNRVLFS